MIALTEYRSSAQLAGQYKVTRNRLETALLGMCAQHNIAIVYHKGEPRYWLDATASSFLADAFSRRQARTPRLNITPTISDSSTITTTQPAERIIDETKKEVAIEPAIISDVSPKKEDQISQPNEIPSYTTPKEAPEQSYATSSVEAKVEPQATDGIKPAPIVKPKHQRVIRDDLRARINFRQFYAKYSKRLGMDDREDYMEAIAIVDRLSPLLEANPNDKQRKKELRLELLIALGEMMTIKERYL